ncbi:MAG: membrane-bound PQQ-dependent dehydrogenase, glucose/quinate/shikimate family, partial [Pararhizobium sp.]
MLIPLTAIVFALIGLGLGAGGLWLAALGGSWYYVFAGLGFLLTAFLLFTRRSVALIVYALLILGTLAWAIWEVGFDWWQLGPRGGVIILLGLWLLLPAIQRSLSFATPSGEVTAAGALPLAVAVIAAIAVAGYSMMQDRLDLAGELPIAAAAATPDLGGNVPEEDWHQYGRTPYGQRYSPLAQITPDNVDTLEVAWQYQTGDVKLPDDVGETTYQVTPLKVRDTLYLCTPHNWAIALDAATGK